MKYVVLAVMIIYILSVGFLLGYGSWQEQQIKTSGQPAQSSTEPSQVDDSSSANSSQPPASEKPTGTITASEVATHNKPSDCWIIINQSVYNASAYLALHPGGADVITAYCGKDATSAFNSQGGRGQHSQRARTELQKYLVGPLAK